MPDELDIDALGKELRNLNKAADSKMAQKKQAVRQLYADLKAARAKGLSFKTIAEWLSKKGIEISAPILKAYMEEIAVEKKDFNSGASVDKLKKKLPSATFASISNMTVKQKVKSLYPELEALLKEGHGYSAIARYLNSEGLRISVATLRAYIGELKKATDDNPASEAATDLGTVAKSTSKVDLEKEDKTKAKNAAGSKSQGVGADTESKTSSDSKQSKSSFTPPIVRNEDL